MWNLDRTMSKPSCLSTRSTTRGRKGIGQRVERADRGMSVLVRSASTPSPSDISAVDLCGAGGFVGAALSRAATVHNREGILNEVRSHRRAIRMGFMWRVRLASWKALWAHSVPPAPRWRNGRLDTSA